MGKGSYRDWITPEGQEKVKKWAAAGWTVEEIAGQVGVTRKTLYDWARRFPEFGAALKSGSGEANEEVKAALYKKCIGYTVKLKKNFKLRRVEYDPDTGRKMAEFDELVTGEDEVHVPADTNAQKFWLTNRDPEHWSSKGEFDGPPAGSLEDFIRRHESGT